ncbi:MAG: CubicO group peptidase (beta-lactamase class C family) [Cryomorphaceae bacterium]|jgi:CubicO group peptidase (beta-lactamase class C family)
MKLSVLTLFLSLLSSVVLTPSAQAGDLEIVKAERVGVSSERLTKIDDLANRYVDQGMFSGIVTMVARDGKIIHQNATGNFGMDNRKPLSMDTLFRIYSMTKPITAAAALILYEEGKFHIDDPVSKYLPEFAEQKIMLDDELVAPDSPMTIRHLLTHTAGLTYGWTNDNPVDIAYQDAKLFESTDLQQLMTKLAGIPLRFQPGTRYHYSVAFDVLGALIERVSGQPLDKFYQSRIFQPLQMRDTFFAVPSDKMHRLASDQGWDYSNKKVAVVPAGQARAFDKVSLFVGGGGLVSSIGDYMRFCQMILNGGELNGTRILGSKTVDFMAANHLSDKVRAEGVGEYPALDFYNGQSMALGYGVVTNPYAMPDLSSKGELSWGGVAGTQFWIDPQQKVIGIAMVQLYQSPWKLRSDFKSATYQALEKLH